MFYQLYTSAGRNLSLFLLAEKLQLWLVGCLSCMKCLLQVFPQHFGRIRVWTLTHPFQTMEFLLL